MEVKIVSGDAVFWVSAPKQNTYPLLVERREVADRSYPNWNPLRWNKLSISVYSTRISVIPSVNLVGLLLLCLCAGLVPSAIRRTRALDLNRCLACDYDLRGTSTLRCPECGSSRRDSECDRFLLRVLSWARNRPIAIYIAVSCSCVSLIPIRISTWYSWPNWPDTVNTLLQACGPFAWLYAWWFGAPGPELVVFGQVILLLTCVWGPWSIVLSRVSWWRCRSAACHAAVAFSWCCLSHVATGVLLWAMLRLT